jgi:hypothetical protein
MDTFMGVWAAHLWAMSVWPFVDEGIAYSTE